MKLHIPHHRHYELLANAVKKKINIKTVFTVLSIVAEDICRIQIGQNNCSEQQCQGNAYK
ncbi:MAG: hypothetical protein R3A12_04400 [Ignavibacteria bacterium]